jgi:hypothetical protein
MKKAYLIIATAMLVCLMLGTVLAAVSYQPGLPNVYEKKNVLQNSYDEKLGVYKVTKECSKVVLNKMTWDKRVIISKMTYTEPRFPQKKYCGIIYRMK